ncbi:MAG: hypothetical protein J6I72_01800 [Muribaculaceae bacterium]|nr:hypothetical protein [Muribaculaceae bacterium]
MNIYIDFDNLSSYASKGGSDSFAACNEMLRKNFNIYFTFPKTSLETCKKKVRETIMPLIKSLTRERGKSTNKPEWDSAFPGHNLSKNFYEGLTSEQLMSIYWLNDENAKAMQEHGNLLFAPVGDELKSLLQLFIEGRAYPIKKYPIRKMTDWSIIGCNASPCTDIIIIDPYLFAQSDLLYDLNAYKVISEVAKRVKGQPLNIVIFTNYKYNAESDNNSDIPITTIQRRLKEIIKEQCGAEPNITIVTMPNKEEHDRTIITNYKVFVSGDSFKYFNDKGKNVSRGRWFDVCSLAHKENQEIVTDYLKDLQEIIKIQEEKGVKNIWGDEQSNFLNFTSKGH